MMRATAAAAAMIAGFTPFFEPVVAQPSPEPETQIGTRFKQKSRAPDPDKGRILQKDVVRCIAYNDKDEVRRVLKHSDSETIYFSDLGYSEDALFERLDFNNCLSRAMSASTYKIHMQISYRLLRGLLAEEVYLMDTAAVPALPANAPLYLEAREVSRDMHPRAVAKAKVADCIVHKAITQADALVRARPGSSAEDDAIEALRPVVSECSGAKADSIDKTVLRLFVADGLWARTQYRAAPGAVTSAEGG